MGASQQILASLGGSWVNVGTPFTALAFAPEAGDEGFQVRVVETGANSVGSATAASLPIGPIGPVIPSPYLLEENFEGVGIPLGWTVGAGSVNWGYTTSPLQGAKMLRMASASSYIYKAFTAGDDRYLYFRYRCDTSPASATSFGFLDAAFTLLASAARTIVGSGANQTVKIWANNGDSSASATEIANGANLHVWIDHHRSGTCVVAMSTTGIKPAVDGSGAVYVTKTAGNVDVGYVYFEVGAAPGSHNIDRVLVKASPIGDNP